MKIYLLIHNLILFVSNKKKQSESHTVIQHIAYCIIKMLHVLSLKRYHIREI